jgi:xanthine dehydrogenase accessory factor
MVRRSVSFAEAVYEGSHTVEGVTARLVSADQIQATQEADEIPILIDPKANILSNYMLTNPQYTILIDARLLKQEPESLPAKPALHIGLGPGFSAGENCQAVIETRRSHTLGRVLWTGSPQPDSREPDGDPRRVLRATAEGVITTNINIGDHVEEGQLLGKINETPVIAPIKGVLRGIIHNGINVSSGMKIGDIDPRNDPAYCKLVSDKSLAIGGGVLEAILVFLREKDQSLLV